VAPADANDTRRPRRRCCTAAWLSGNPGPVHRGGGNLQSPSRLERPADGGLRRRRQARGRRLVVSTPPNVFPTVTSNTSSPPGHHAQCWVGRISTARRGAGRYEPALLPRGICDSPLSTAGLAPLAEAAATRPVALRRAPTVRRRERLAAVSDTRSIACQSTARRSTRRASVAVLAGLSAAGRPGPTARACGRRRLRAARACRRSS
jgi:hypothetical protein